MNKRTLLCSLLLTLSLTGCGGCGKRKRVKDFTKKKKGEHVKHNDQKKIKLDEAWEKDLNKLPPEYKERKDRLRAALFNFPKVKRAELREVVEAVRTDRGQAEFLYDLTSADFTRRELERLLNIILHMKSQNSTLILKICAELGKVSFWEKIKFYAQKKQLTNPDESLLDRLIAKLYTEDLPE